MEILAALAAVAIVAAIVWLVRQGPPQDGEVLPGNRDESHLGGP